MKEKLTDLQYAVTQQCGTEPPFHNEYWDNKDAGLYVDLISGVPLFSSADKFDSGTGWPSFTKPVAPEVLKEKSDSSAGMVRTSIRRSVGFASRMDDGPGETGLRYCINSASLRFIPEQELNGKGMPTTYQPPDVGTLCLLRAVFGVLRAISASSMAY